MNRTRLLATMSTVAGMEFRQLAGVGRRKVRSELYPRLPVSLDDRYEAAASPGGLATDPVVENIEVIRRTASEETRAFADSRLERLRDGTVCFLNEPVDVASSAPYDINAYAGQRRDFPRLWSLKLWSFEPVEWLLYGADGPDETLESMLVEWLADWRDAGVTAIDSPGYLRSYWTPYAVSRRIENLGRLAGLLSRRGDSEALDAVATHLAKNVRFLADHVEYDVGGNHVVENGCALVTGGVLLANRTAWNQGLAVLREELPEQLLDDGLHFERSPMYHAILLSRVTCALDVLHRTGRGVPRELRDAVVEMHEWLASAAPDGAGFALLNDAVYGEGPSRESCLRTVEAVLEKDPGDDRAPLRGEYLSLRDDGLMVLVDGGRASPRHLPAHGHNDVANVVVWVDGEPVVVDTGVYSYRPGERREYARSVAAHNTVQVEAVQQAVTAGRFVMGPRVEPDVSVVDRQRGSSVRVEYAAPRFARTYRHTRNVTLAAERLRIDDRVASSRDVATARLHLAPDLRVETAGGDDTTRFVVTKPGMPRITIAVGGATTTEVVETERYPEYGTMREQPTLEFEFEPSVDPDEPSLSQTVAVERGER